MVVSPLVALMQDQVEALQLAGVAADTINSSRGREDNVAAWRRAATGETRLLYLSPERLMTERMLAALAKTADLADRGRRGALHLAMGPSLPPRLRSAVAVCARPFPAVPIMALTATADEATRADIAARLFGGDVDPDRARLRPAQYRAHRHAQGRAGSSSFSPSSRPGPGKAASSIACRARRPKKPPACSPPKASARWPITPA